MAAGRPEGAGTRTLIIPAVSPTGPSYERLGIAAPELLVVLRVVRGIGIGGEFGGTCSLLAEFGAERRSRAFWMSLATLGIPLGGIAASGVMLVMSKTFATTGWWAAMLLSV